MALQVLPILKALAPLVVNASGLVSSFRSSESNLKIEDRLRKLEGEALRAGEVLTGVTEQLQALAHELRVQAEVNEAHEKRVKAALLLGVLGMGTALAALGMVAFS
jgi:hypothetical protein